MFDDKSLFGLNSHLCLVHRDDNNLITNQVLERGGDQKGSLQVGNLTQPDKMLGLQCFGCKFNARLVSSLMCLKENWLLAVTMRFALSSASSYEASLKISPVFNYRSCS